MEINNKNLDLQAPAQVVPVAGVPLEFPFRIESSILTASSYRNR